MKYVPLIRGKKVEPTLKLSAGPMETKTMSMLQFTPYKVKPVRLAKDPHPSYYSPNTAKFVGESTTKDTFRGVMGERAVSLKPREPNISIEKNEAMNLNTHYKETFVKHGLSLCESKAFLIAQALAVKNNNNKLAAATAASSVELANTV